jgi:glutathione S-transferase
MPIEYRQSASVGDDCMFTARYTLFHDALMRSVRVRWLLQELVGDDFKLQYVDVYRGEQYGADYMAINPNHAVPTLELTLDGRSMCMIESAAMIVLLADAYPEKRMAPPAELTFRRADYLQIIHFSASMDAMLWQIRVHEHVLRDEEKDPRTSRRYRSKFSKEVEPQLKTRLERASFICGNDFCAADCIVSHVVMWAGSYGLCRDQVFQDYLAKVAQRPAYQRAFDDVHRFVAEVPRDSAALSQFTG